MPKTTSRSNSVVCVGKDASVIRVQLGKTKSKCHSENNHFKELSRSGGRYSQDSRRWTSSKGFKIFEEDIHCEPEQFNDRIILVSMHNDILWKEKGNTEKVCSKFHYNSETRSQIPWLSLAFVGTWIRKKNGMGRVMVDQTEIGTETQK